MHDVYSHPVSSGGRIPELPTAHPERGLVAPLLRPDVAFGDARRLSRKEADMHSMTRRRSIAVVAIVAAGCSGAAPADGTAAVHGSPGPSATAHTDQLDVHLGAGDTCTGDFTADWRPSDELRLSDVRAGDLVDRGRWGLKPLQRIE